MRYVLKSMRNEEQIEEMGKVMLEKIKDPLDNSRYIIFGKSLRREIARIYYNAGYRKLPKDSVVLSKEEYESDLTAQYDVGYEFGRKETAEKIFEVLYQWLDLENIEKYGFVTIQKFDFLRKFREIYKQLGLEIKE